MIVFTPQISNRLLYVLQFVFAEFSSIPYTITQSKEEFINHTETKINYSNEPVCKEEIHIQPSGLLEEKELRHFIPEVKTIDETLVLFPVTNADEKAYPFDIFSAIFFMISRYEEYINPSKDQWHRFPAKASLAYKANFLHLPVVDIWLQQFFQQLTIHHSSLALHKQTTVNFTYDVDVAYAYKGRKIGRQAGATVKDILRIQPYNLAQRTAVLAGYLEDPFDTYEYIKKESINPIVFFLLCERKTKYDHNINPKHKIMELLVNKVKQWSEVGIHPSFYSSEKEEKISNEKQQLENLTSNNIIKSRQHYLRFKMPQTFRSLLRSGIREEYSLSFAEMPGFRAGTCTPFYFFDIERDKATELKLFPACIMDSTFRDDIVVPMKEALHVFIRHFEEVNKVNGHFISIWHNDTLAANNKQHFRWLHQQILQYIRKRLKESYEP